MPPRTPQTARERAEQDLASAQAMARMVAAQLVRRARGRR